MDLLFKRYASPYLLVDQMLETGDFFDFVIEVFQSNEDDRLWDFFLHKVEGKTFDEYKAEIFGNSNLGMTKNDIETTVSDSYSLIKDFEPI